MEPSLKREWENPLIPEEVYRRARDVAWSRLQKPPLVRRPALWATAAIAMAVVTAIPWLFWRSGLLVPEPPIKQVGKSVPKRPTVQEPRGLRAAAETPARRVRSTTLVDSTAKSPAPAPQEPATTAMSAVPDRLVLNFILPESGVRMIWILDKNFQLSGEKQ
jgi:hypothetical protein